MKELSSLKTFALYTSLSSESSPLWVAKMYTVLCLTYEQRNVLVLKGSPLLFVHIYPVSTGPYDTLYTKIEKAQG